jgi:hypothetical protein
MEALGNEILGECMSFRVPKTVTLIETRTAVLAYLQGHPEELKDPASYAVYQVMLKAYPCPG